jgi:hypothetical protein
VGPSMRGSRLAVGWSAREWLRGAVCDVLKRDGSGWRVNGRVDGLGYRYLWPDASVVWAGRLDLAT